MLLGDDAFKSSHYILRQKFNPSPDNSFDRFPAIDITFMFIEHVDFNRGEN